MPSDYHSTQVANRLGYNVPKKRKRGTVLMCIPCRDSRQKCSYSEEDTYPEACLLCVKKGRGCSAPEFKHRAKRSDSSHNKRHNGHDQVLTLPSDLVSSPSHSKDAVDLSCNRAIILLCLDEVLSTCIEELVNLTTDMMRPNQRHSRCKIHEDNVRELSEAIERLNKISQMVNYKMEEAARDAKSMTLFQAQNALRTHHFRSTLSWGADDNVVAQCQRTIYQFLDMGHTSLAYVLQVRLLRENIQPPKLEVLVRCRNQFVRDVDAFFNTTSCEFSSRQMFAPKELVRISAFERAISNDGRPDYLGRSVAQIRLDAGLVIEWLPDDVHHKDVLGRTCLHQAVHRRSLSIVQQLRSLGADLEQCCMNRLSPLHIAACQGHIEMFNFLVALRPDLVDVPDSAGRTAFWYAARGSHFGVMRVMCLRKDVNIAHRDNQKISPIAAAVYDGRHGVLGYLCRKKIERIRDGIAPETERYFDHLPLLVASEAGQKECLELLLQRGVRTWKAGGDEYDVLLHMARQRGDVCLEQKVLNLQITDFRNTFAEVARERLPKALDSEFAEKAVFHENPYSMESYEFVVRLNAQFPARDDCLTEDTVVD